MDEPTQDPGVPDIVGRVRAELQQGLTSDDATRLSTLDELYRCLESELEGDLDQAGPARR